MIRKVLVVIVLSALAISTTAAEFGGKIKALYVDHYGRVLFNIDGGSGQPLCAPALWQFRFGMEQTGAKEWFSMLLTARATGTMIIIGYEENPSGECNVKYAYYLN